MRFLEVDFYRNPSSKDGRRSTCKSCERIRRCIKRPDGTTPGLNDTPYGIAECSRCQKLIPLTESGKLEQHFRMVDYTAPGAFNPVIRQALCGDK